VANLALYSLNCDVMTLLGRDSYYLVWGGSWAIRREVFEQLEFRKAWKGTLSDDLVASQLLREARLPVRFEPAGVVASPVDHTWRGMISFVRRQYLVGRYYVPHWWLFALLGATFSNLLWLAQLAAVIWGLLGGPLPAWIPAIGLTTLLAVYAYRGHLRQDLVRTYFPDRVEQLRTARRFDVWWNPLGGLVNWLGVFSSMFGQHITWRGICYRVLSGGKIRTMHRVDCEPATLPIQTVVPSQPQTSGLARLRKAG
jgi:hypothetical protein